MVTQWIPRSIPAGATLAALVLAACARAAWRSLHERGDEGRQDKVRPGPRHRCRRGGRELIARCSATRPGPGSRSGCSTMTRTSGIAGSARSRSLGTTDAARRAGHDDRRRHRRDRDPQRPAEPVMAASGGRARGEGRRQGAPGDQRAPHDSVGIRDLRDINLSDVLGRNQLDTDIDAIAGYLAEAGARHRRGRLDRVRAVPSDPPLRARRADDARSRRVGAPRRAAVDPRPGAARLRRRDPLRHPRRERPPRVFATVGPRSCSTPRR